MKRNILLYILYIAVALFFISCNFSIPKKIHVKGDPGIYLPLGEKEFLITDYVSIKEITKLIGDDIEGLGVYDFHDTADPLGIQKYLIHYPLTDITLDIGEYLNDLDLGGDLSRAISQSIDIPAAAVDEDKTISVDLGGVFSAIEEQASFVVQSVPLIVPNGSGDSSGLLLLPMGTDAFTRVTFTSGNMEIGFAVSPAISDDLKITIDNVKLMDASQNVLTSTGGSVTLDSVNSTGSVVMNLAAVVWPEIVKISASISFSGGTPGQSAGNLGVSAELSDIAFSAAEGIKLDAPVELDISSTVDIDSLPALFKSAEIGAGSLFLSVGPDTSSGVTMNGLIQDIAFSIQQNSGLDLIDIGKGVTSLSGQTLNRNDLTVAGKIIIATGGNGASISGIQGGSIDYNMSIKTSIEQFAEVTINTAELDSDILSPSPITVDLPSEFDDWVKKITFDEIGISANFTELIVSSGINLKVKCDAFGIDQTRSLTTGTDILFSNSPFDFVPSGSQSIDFVVTIDLPAEITVADVKPGASVKAIEGTAELVADWTSVTVNPGNLGFSGEFPEAGKNAVDLSVIADYLDDGIDLSSLPLRVYLSGPSAFDAQLSMLLEAEYTGASGSPLYDDSLVMKTPLDFSTVVDQVFTGELPEPSLLLEEEFTDILKKRPEDLRLSYNITSGGPITLSRTDVDAKKPFKVELLFELPLKLSVDSGPGGTGSSVITFAGMLSDGSSDLFGRKAGADNSKTQDLLKYLNTMTLSFNNRNHIIDSAAKEDMDNLALFIKADMDSGSEFEKQIFNLKEGETSVSLDKEEIERVMNQIPFSPKLEMNIPDGEYFLKRGGTFDTTISITVVSTIDEVIELGGGK
ncbi:MAG: hypothetical protein LBR47_05910 [Spirochaetaceae bacterium]|jgi:hypothetical protein|nr:hypothetical protein [Spirochaetaceae bacterium]